ncbi:FRG domain-containing protein (plasmid) [Rhizobium sp. CC1099]|uniref:FRG domain-containing protein n=1 Tax=Rhizobium sp. CC1099 TaxID=3039160 RepID=UPI0024B18FDF|nr:FRG domain-containing protein [Rhizobium sp. CC1099]WFU91990.1 FRG domain-containing protein [Rhizobium sp. CC1099]
MFSRKDPASDINVLLDFLGREHREGVLYRGQTKDYTYIVPSGYRHLTAPDQTSPGQIQLDLSLDDDPAHATPRFKWRRQAHFYIVTKLGVALGNLVSQQYGLTSECIDVTHNPRIAAFFATRRWPHYRHHDVRDEMGVIYRFRRTPDIRPSHTSIKALDLWFRMGQGEGVYFEDFVKQPNGIMERDLWNEREQGRGAVVATLPTLISWDEVLESIHNIRGAHADLIRDTVLPMDWHISRAAAQEGGFIRPAFFYQSRVASYLHVVDPIKMRLTLGQEIEDDGLPWPRAHPSLALKEKLIAMEDVKQREGFEAFYFRHSPQLVTSLYRCELWPEPSEDPIFGFTWHAATLIGSFLIEGDLPPIDNPVTGVLDRGYKVLNEIESIDGREFIDRARGQLEDALENQAGGVTRCQDFEHEAQARFWLGDTNNALRAAMKAIRRDPARVDCYVLAAEILMSSRRAGFADRFLRRAHKIDRVHPMVLRSVGRFLFGHGDLDQARDCLRLALEKLEDPKNALYRKHREDLTDTLADVEKAMHQPV